MLPWGAHATVSMHSSDSHWAFIDYLWFSLICYWLSSIFIDLSLIVLDCDWFCIEFLWFVIDFHRLFMDCYLSSAAKFRRNSSVESFSSAIASPSEGSHAPETQSAGNQSPESQSPHAGAPSISKTSHRSPIHKQNLTPEPHPTQHSTKRYKLQNTKNRKIHSLINNMQPWTHNIGWLSIAI